MHRLIIAARREAHLFALTCWLWGRWGSEQSRCREKELEIEGQEERTAKRRSLEPFVSVWKSRCSCSFRNSQRNASFSTDCKKGCQDGVVLNRLGCVTTTMLQLSSMRGSRLTFVLWRAQGINSKKKKNSTVTVFTCSSWFHSFSVTNQSQYHH